MEFDLSVPIRGDANAVFALLADVQRYATGPGSAVRSMTKTPSGRTGVGTRWREVVRIGPGARLTMHSEVTECVPGRRLAMRFHGGGMAGSLRYTITDAGGGNVRLRQEETLELRGPLRPLRGVVRRMLEPRLRRRLVEIRDLVETSRVRG